MNIALLSYEYPPDTGFGGIGTYAYYQARALVKLGHRVRVFAGALQPGVFHSEHDGVRVTRTKLDGWVQRSLKPARAREWYWFQNRVETAHAQYVALRAALERETFDIIEAPECGADAAAISCLLRVPVAVRFHSPARLIMETYPTPQMDRRLTAFVERIAMDRARVRTACSQFVANEVADRMGVRRPVHVIPNGIDLTLFDRDGASDVRSRFGVPSNALVVLFANRLEDRKGIHLIPRIAAQVMKRFKHAHFVLAGRDLFGYVANVVLPQMQAQGLADRFHVLGGLPLADVRALMKTADVFLLPSLWENCPYSCIEAMAAGCAIASADCGGMPELVNHRVNGLIARTGDAVSFANAVEELAADSALRRRLGDAARQTVEGRLTDVAIAGRLAAVYAAALGREPTAAPAQLEARVTDRA